MYFQIKSILVRNLSVGEIFLRWLISSSSLQSLTPLVFYICIFVKMLVPMKITYYKVKQLIWLEGNIEKAVFRG